MNYEKDYMFSFLFPDKRNFAKLAILGGLLLSLMAVIEGVNAWHIFHSSEKIIATICEVEESYDVDYGIDYSVYVSYEYEGFTYQYVYLTTSGDETWLDNIGKSITLYINAENPREVYQNMSNLPGTVVSLAVIPGIAAVIYGMLLLCDGQNFFDRKKCS